MALNLQTIAAAIFALFTKIYEFILYKQGEKDKLEQALKKTEDKIDDLAREIDKLKNKKEVLKAQAKIVAMKEDLDVK